MTPRAFQIERSASIGIPAKGSGLVGDPLAANALMGDAMQFRQAAAHPFLCSAAGSTRRMTSPQPGRLVERVTRASQASPAADDKPCPGFGQGMGAAARGSPPVLKMAVRLLTARRAIQ